MDTVKGMSDPDDRMDSYYQYSGRTIMSFDALGAEVSQFEVDGALSPQLSPSKPELLLAYASGEKLLAAWRIGPRWERGVDVVRQLLFSVAHENIRIEPDGS
jgi:hypothetical protein